MEEEENKCYHGGTNNKRKSKDRLGYSANGSLKAEMSNCEFCLKLRREVFSCRIPYLLLISALIVVTTAVCGFSLKSVKFECSILGQALIVPGKSKFLVEIIFS